MLISVVLLLGIGIYITYAWYTRITGVSAIDFTAARWDFNANYQADSIKVNVFEYESVYGGNIAAPGTAGTVNLKLGAEESDVDVEYILMVDHETMSDEFQKRIFFYYTDENGEQVEFEYGVNGLSGVIAARSSSIVEFNWEWVYDYDGYLEKLDKEKFVAASGILRVLYDSPIGTFTTIDEFKELYEYISKDAEILSSALVNPGSGEDGTYYQVLSSAVSFQSLWNNRLSERAFNALQVMVGMTPESRAILFANEAQYGGSSSAILTLEEIEKLKPYKDANATDPSCLYNLFTSNYGPEGDSATADLKEKYDIMLILRSFSKAQRELLFANSQYLDKCFGQINLEVEGQNYSDSIAYLEYYTAEHGYLTLESFFEAYLSEYEEFDSYDNKVGANPKYYQSQMTATIYIIGTQVKPEAVVNS